LISVLKPAIETFLGWCQDIESFRSSAACYSTIIPAIHSKWSEISVSFDFKKQSAKS
jgi:hypothetical protein